MTRFSIFGLIAGLIEICIVLPQLYKTFKTKKVEDVAVFTWVLFVTSNTLWLLYGIFTHDAVVVAVNTFNIAKNSLMLVLIYRYRYWVKYAK